MKIRIQGKAIIRFDQVKEMTLTEFKELRGTLEQGDVTIVEAWIDAADINEFEFDAMDINVSKEQKGTQLMANDSILTRDDVESLLRRNTMRGAAWQFSVEACNTITQAVELLERWENCFGGGSNVSHETQAFLARYHASDKEAGK